MERLRELRVTSPAPGIFLSELDNPKLRHPRAVRDDYLTDRVADILEGI
jgi:hypothetical protein